ncbi:hypothetical protein MRB53_037122 [Persea americana]|nr:hypothetical protein MRB53_037122 [Persea americana]
MYASASQRHCALGRLASLVSTDRLQHSTGIDASRRPVRRSKPSTTYTPSRLHGQIFRERGTRLVYQAEQRHPCTNLNSFAMNIHLLLNPQDQAPFPSSSKHMMKRRIDSSDPVAKKQKMSGRSDKADTPPAQVNGPVNFPPYEHIQDEVLARAVDQYRIAPSSGIAEYPTKLPYESGKPCHGLPSRPTVPYKTSASASQEARSVRKVCQDRSLWPQTPLVIISNKLTHPGYWIPFAAARALASIFTHSIRHALIPLFGPDFPATCKTVSDPLNIDWRIDPAIVASCTEEAKTWTAGRTLTAPFRPAARKTAPRANGSAAKRKIAPYSRAKQQRTHRSNDSLASFTSHTTASSSGGDSSGSSSATFQGSSGGSSDFQPSPSSSPTRGHGHFTAANDRGTGTATAFAASTSSTMPTHKVAHGRAMTLSSDKSSDDESGGDTAPDHDNDRTRTRARNVGDEDDEDDDPVTDRDRHAAATLLQLGLGFGVGVGLGVGLGRGLASGLGSGIGVEARARVRADAVEGIDMSMGMGTSTSLSIRTGTGMSTGDDLVNDAGVDAALGTYGRAFRRG